MQSDEKLPDWRAYQEQWVSRVRDVPHLQLLDDVDVPSILAECRHALSTLGDLPQYVDGKLGPLHVAGVIDVYDDPLDGSKRIIVDDTKVLTHSPTQIGRGMPHTCALIDRLTSLDGRVKISVLPPNTKVRFHTHSDSTYVVHIPLETTPEVKMVVMANNVLYEQHYPLGTAWLFNSHHFHGVENASDKPRMHLWCNFGQVKKSFPNHKLNALVDAALHRLV